MVYGHVHNTVEMDLVQGFRQNLWAKNKSGNKYPLPKLKKSVTDCLVSLFRDTSFFIISLDPVRSIPSSSAMRESSFLAGRKESNQTD